jgi:DNA-binding NarL/FixJ family response regulator
MRGEKGPVTVVLGQFGAVFDNGLRDILGTDPSLSIMAAGLDQAELEVAIAQHAPQVAVLDENHAARPVLLRRLRATHRGLGLVLLTHLPISGSAPTSPVASAVRVSRDAALADIRAAIHHAAGGRGVAAEAPSLTARETEVMEQISWGYSYAKIASSLSISPETVRTHSANIRRKLGAENKWELVGIPVSGRSRARGGERHDAREHPVNRADSQ